MALLQILPTELKFFDWFDKSAENVLNAAERLHELLSDYHDVESRVAKITEIEHRGDFIVHEILDLLSRTFLTPLEGEEIRSLTSSLDDVVDNIEAAASALVLYKVEKTMPESVELARLLHEMAKEISIAVPMLADKKLMTQVQKHTIEINRLENEADRVLRMALARLVEERGDWFELFRWKEILEIIETATDCCEDVADVLGAVVQKNA